MKNKMKTIKLTKNKMALVDDDMFDYLNQFKWFVTKSNNTFYVVRKFWTPEGKRNMQMMHHLVLGITRLPIILGLDTDHKDGDGLNNQRHNLQIITHRKNTQNKVIHRGGRLFECSLKNDQKRKKRWRAEIQINGKRVFLGYFTTEQEAHEAYLAAEKDLV